MTVPIIQTSDLESTFRALKNRNPQELSRQEIPYSPDYKSIPSQNLAPATTVSGAFPNSMTRQASAAGTIYGQPQFFSPVHTPINWQIPSKRLEIYQWMIVDGDVLQKDHTYRNISDIRIEGDAIRDSVSGGIMFENPIMEKLFSGNAILTNPSKFGIRECTNKQSYSFGVYGHYKTFSVTEEHPIYVLDGDMWSSNRKIKTNTKYRRSKNVPCGKPKKKIHTEMLIKKEARNVNKNDYLITPIEEFTNGNTVGINLAYMMGLCASDGCIASDYSLRFYINKLDGHLEHLTTAISSNNFRYSISDHSNSNKVSIVNVGGDCIGREFGKYIVNKLTKKKFTEAVFGLSKLEILNILGGYFDGDGYYDRKNKILVANNSSEDMVNQLWWMALKCGINASIGKYKINKSGGIYTSSTHYYRLFIPSSDVEKLQPYIRSGKIPCDFIPKSKREFSFFYSENGVKYLCQPIDAIKKFLYSGVGYDMQIDCDRSYVLSGFKVSNCRFFYENEPKVASSIDFYSYFPMNDFDHECKDRDVKRHFDKLKKKLNLAKWLTLISHEIHLLGDCFPFVEIQCDICHGEGRIGGDICEHEGGTIRRIVILNPDYVDVHTSPLNPDPIIALKPDEELINMVQKRTPGYDKLTPQVRNLIGSGQPIRLDNRNVSHLKYGEGGYSRYGTGMVRRLFPILSYKTKLMVAQWIVAERLIVPIKVVKVGSEERPAGPSDIAIVQSQLAQTANDPNLTIVTQHAFEIDYVGANGKILTLSNEFELINQEILDGMMINNALLNGEGPNFSAAAVGIEAMIQRLETFRRGISEWIEEKIYLPEAIRQGFVEVDEESGEEEYIYPKIKWKSMHLRDQQQYRTFIIQLYEKGLVSAQTVLEAFELDADREIERKRYDSLQQLAVSKGVGEMGGGFGVPPGQGGGGGGGMGGGLGGMDMGGGGGGGMGGGMDLGGGGAPPSPISAAPPPTTAESDGLFIKEAQVQQQQVNNPGGPANPQNYGGKILKQRTREKVDRENKKIYDKNKPGSGGSGSQRDEKGRIIFTNIERAMIPRLMEYQQNGLINYEIIPQYVVEYSGTDFPVDFAIPQLKIAIEADGELFHSTDKQVQRDKERDRKIAQMGWTVLRFTDAEIEKKMERVMSSILKTIMQKEILIKKQMEDVDQNPG